MRRFEEFLDLSKTCVQGYPSFGTLENWFFVAPFNNALIKAWRQEFKEAWTMGPHRYWTLHRSSVPEGLTDSEYLTQHVCFLRVLRRFPADSVHWLGSNTLAGAAWDPRNPFYWTARSRPGSEDWWPVGKSRCWAADTLFDQYGLDPKLSQAPFFKFRGTERHCVFKDTLTVPAKLGRELPILILDLLPSW